MSKTNRTVNLLDSIEIIPSDNILCDLIKEIAPSLNYNWKSTAFNPRKRSEALFAQLIKFQKESPTQHCELTTTLSTIALISAAGTGSYIHQQISRKSFLKQQLENYDFGVPQNAHCASHLAAWLLLQTLKLPEGSVEQESAKTIWDEAVSTTTRLKSKVHYRRFEIYEPTVRTEKDQDANISAKFIDYLRLLLLSRRINVDTPMPIGYVRQNQDNAIQFFFKIPNFPRHASQINDAGNGYEIKRDRNADSIDILFYPNINLLKISDNPDINTGEVARHFIEDVLGTTIDNSQKNKVYTHILEQFKTRNCLDRIRSELTDEALSAKASIWIEEMSFSYGRVMSDETDDQMTFKEITPQQLSKKRICHFPPMIIHACTENDDVYEILNQAFRDDFHEDCRTIHRIKLVVKLRNEIKINEKRSRIPKTEFYEYPITISDTKRKPSYPEFTPASHRHIIEGLLDHWKFCGIPKASIVL